jgi:hypothetical protein
MNWRNDGKMVNLSYPITIAAGIGKQERAAEITPSGSLKNNNEIHQFIV